VEDLLRATYAFAQRFLPADEWALLSQLKEGYEMDTAMRW
jgi:hypothetical protein|tara:strand:+ start:453 stop:572 length:120 start_codon:yes stop_codon:yes gene_type:complete